MLSNFRNWVQQPKQRIMCHIYGSKQNKLLQFGVADADNIEDFNVKLESLKSVWEPLVPVFIDGSQRDELNSLNQPSFGVLKT